MLIDDSRTREVLSKIIYRLCSDPVVRQDLMQEALVHLWLLEERRPGQTQSWYLQGCKFHLQNHLGAGRSIDSPKRNNNRVKVTANDEPIDLSSFVADTGDELFDQISAQDIFTILRGRLSPIEQVILNLLAQGLGAREIALQLKVSHPTIIKYRRKIATLAIRLGVPPLPKYSRRPALAAAP
jgi:DNA-binding CsgD family transcriptional regulator